MNMKPKDLNKQELPYEYKTHFTTKDFYLTVRNTHSSSSIDLRGLKPDQMRAVLEFIMQFDSNIDAWPYPVFIFFLC